MTEPRRLAHQIVVSTTDGSITIDGDPLPWYVAEGWTIDDGGGGIATLHVSIFADRIICTETPTNRATPVPRQNHT